MLLISNFSLPATRGEAGSQEKLSPRVGSLSASVGTVRDMQVYIEGPAFRRTARCECGWNATPRWLRASAVVDAGMHAAQTGHVQTAAAVQSAEPIVVLRAS